MLAGLLSIGGCKELNPDFVPTDDGSTSDATTSGSTTTLEPTMTSPTESSTFTSSMADDASSLDEASSGSATSTTSTSSVDETSSGGDCDDVDGDNEVPADATMLEAQACEAEPATFAGVIVDLDDEDWLALPGIYTGNAECGDDNPVTSLVLDDDTLVVCGYLTCNEGNPNVVDCGDGTEASAPDGEPGCCGGSSVQLTFNCAGSMDESGTILVHVSADEPVDCAPYELSADFDA